MTIIELELCVSMGAIRVVKLITLWYNENLVTQRWLALISSLSLLPNAEYIPTRNEIISK